VSCSELCLAAGVPLAGTATQAERFLVIEHAGPWGRDAVADSELPADVAEALLAFDGRVMLARRPGRPRATTTAFLAEVVEEGGTLRRFELARLDDVRSIEEHGGTAVDGTLLLVCVHRRRDVCCARLGVPLFNALRPHVPHDRLWRSSHHGGHRFAANVLALPAGIQLGRVTPGEARRVAAALDEGRIPLEHYRGRTLHAPEVQAADAAVRSREGLDRLGDVRLVEHVGDRVVLSTPPGLVEVELERVPGPTLPASCGAEPEPTASFAATVRAVR
jgi:hypothetical protein